MDLWRARGYLVVLAALSSLSAVPASALPLLSEDFDGVTFAPEQTQRFGVPTKATFGSDQDGFGARFEQPDGGSIASDVGVQKTGGLGNNTPVGLLMDDAGLMYRLATTGLKDITLQFQWRTGNTEGSDLFVAGYFVGDLDLGHPTGFAADRTIDLRNKDHGFALGDGPWNWNPINDLSNSIPPHAGNWIELLRARNDTSWNTATFALTGAANQPEVWVAFWLDNGGNDIGLLDNVMVTGTPSPEPGTLLLLGSGLLGTVAFSRRFRKRA